MGIFALGEIDQHQPPIPMVSLSVWKYSVNCLCIDETLTVSMITSKTEVLQTPSAIEVNLGQGVE